VPDEKEILFERLPCGSAAGNPVAMIRCSGVFQFAREIAGVASPYLSADFGAAEAASFFIAGKLACSRPFANRKRIAPRAMQLRFCENKRNVVPRAPGRRMLIGRLGEKGNSQGGSSSLVLDANSGGGAAFL